MSYFVDPNTQQVYYQAPAQQIVTDSGTAATAASETKVYAVPVQQVPAVPATTSTFLGLDVSSFNFWKGAALGAGAALLATSGTVQNAVVKTVSKGMAAASAGVEEFKEKYEDAKAEVDAEDAGKTE